MSWRPRWKNLLIIFTYSISHPFSSVASLAMQRKKIDDCCHTALVAVVTIEDHVRGIFSCVSQRIGILRLVKGVFVAVLKLG